MIQTKFIVISKLECGIDQFVITLTPIAGGSVENDEFYRSTPAGKIELMTLNAAAAAQFIVGQSFYVYFEHAA